MKFFFRYSAQSKLSEAEDLLYDGAGELFKKKQISSGTDLSKLYIEVLEKRDDRTEDEREKVHIFQHNIDKYNVVFFVFREFQVLTLTKLEKV